MISQVMNKSLQTALLFTKTYHVQLASVVKNCFYVKMYSSSVKEQKTNVDGLNINYVKVGRGPNAVLCLPGALGSWWTDFKPQIENLDKSKFTVIAWDPPGYGKSRPPDRKFTTEFYNDDAAIAAKLMSVLGFQKYSLLGWSDGGISSLILASKHKNEIDKMVVWGCNAYVTSVDVELYKGIRDISTWSKGMREPMVAIYGEQYFKDTWEGWVDIFPKIMSEKGGDICKWALPNIHCQTLIVHGAKDVLVPSEHPQHLLENIKNAKLHIFENGKHNLHLRYADEFNKLVEEFLTS